MNRHFRNPVRGVRRVRRARARADRGAAVVEFAIIAPLLLLMLFGIIEFGFMFGQKLDVSQGTREGARLASVNHQTTSGSSGSTQTDEIVAETCSRMEVASEAEVSIAFAGGTAIGDSVTMTISTPVTPVTGLFDSMLASSTITSDVEVRLEQTATFSATTDQDCP